MQRKRMGRFARSDAGTSAVEFAIVAPVLILVLTGIIAYGIYLGAVHGVAQLAADAARASVAGLTNDERAAIAQRQVANNVSSYPFIDASHLNVTAGPLAIDPTQFQVLLSYDAHALPIWSIYSGLPLPSQTITRSATVKNGGF